MGLIVLGFTLQRFDGGVLEPAIHIKGSALD